MIWKSLRAKKIRSDKLYTTKQIVNLLIISQYSEKKIVNTTIKISFNRIFIIVIFNLNI